MEIESRFTVPLPPAEAWDVLLDIPRIAPCMPGAKLTGADDEARVYNGEVQVRLGPVLLAFKGKARITDLDRENWRATVKAEGRDTKGRGGASADVLFSLEPAEDGARTECRITTNLNLTGSVAQYGRGSGMINDLANHLVGQFADNLRQEIADSQPAGQPGKQPENQSAAAEDAPATTPADAPPEPRRQARQSAPISGFRLMLWLLRQRLRRLFGGGR
ncbi:SRPBCC family protein [Marivibrio halodurans]|uniref:SRPBCC family protein n=1 Tax=Marivibrio halodurans TaxID=2039722 RepID=A0A8J7V291_9PROT|nr:SRPBCC family protein [Marivibrio halodurans]MBP5858586.1 SRPBCC family protein [Marivibrio halodurans]